MLARENAVLFPVGTVNRPFSSCLHMDGSQPSQLPYELGVYRQLVHRVIFVGGGRGKKLTPVEMRCLTAALMATVAMGTADFLLPSMPCKSAREQGLSGSKDCRGSLS